MNQKKTTKKAAPKAKKSAPKVKKKAETEGMNLKNTRFVGMASSVLPEQKKFLERKAKERNLSTSIILREILHAEMMK